MKRWERRALRRAERAHGMDPETRQQTNELLKRYDWDTEADKSLAERFAETTARPPAIKRGSSAQ